MLTAQQNAVIATVIGFVIMASWLVVATIRNVRRSDRKSEQ